jgi:hypothetical protein
MRQLPQLAQTYSGWLGAVQEQHTLGLAAKWQRQSRTHIRLWLKNYFIWGLQRALDDL